MNSSDKAFCKGVWPKATCIVGFTFCALGKVVIIPGRRRKIRLVEIECICILHFEKAMEGTIRNLSECVYHVDFLLKDLQWKLWHSEAEGELTDMY